MDLAVGLAFTASRVEQDGDVDEFGLLIAASTLQLGSFE